MSDVLTYKVANLGDNKGEGVVRVTTEDAVLASFKLERTKLTKELPYDKQYLMHHGLQMPYLIKRSHLQLPNPAAPRLRSSADCRRSV